MDHKVGGSSSEEPKTSSKPPTKQDIINKSEHLATTNHSGSGCYSSTPHLEQRQRAAERRELLLRTSRLAEAGGPSGNVDPAGSIGQEITNSLRRMMQTMQDEIDRSSENYLLMESSSKRLEATQIKYESFSGILNTTRALIGELWRREKGDLFYIYSAFAFFGLAVLYIGIKRLWIGSLLRLVFGGISLIFKRNKLAIDSTPATSSLSPPIGASPSPSSSSSSSLSSSTGSFPGHQFSSTLSPEHVDL